MTIFDYKDYRNFLKEWIMARPNTGRGGISRLAKIIGVHSSLLSLILSGKREMTAEQAMEICHCLNLSEKETDYFLVMIQIARAGTQNLKNHLELKRKSLQSESLQLRTKVTKAKQLSDADRDFFYSSWIYSGIRLYCSTHPKGKSIEEISERFQWPRPLVSTAIEFLMSCGLVSETAGKYQMKAQRTYISSVSPAIARHHINWRMKSLQTAERIESEELMITSPISISKDDFQKIKKMLLDLITKSSEIVRDSEAEEVACLNLDLFWVR